MEIPCNAQWYPTKLLAPGKKEGRIARLKYVRYADDFLLGFNGPKEEAEEIKQKLEVFLHDHLKLELSQAKTLITHARTGVARFLGYEIHAIHNDTKQTKGKRSVNGQIGFRVPKDIIREKCQDYTEKGNPIHRPEMLKNSVYTIISTYQAEYRGLVEYYRIAYNLNHALNRLKWDMERSLTKTLAAKEQIPIPQVYRKYKATIMVEGKLYKGLQVTIEREGKKPLVVQWGGIPLTWNIKAIPNDQPERIWSTRSELEKRLLAEICEYCGSHEKCQVHNHYVLSHLTTEFFKQGIDVQKQMMTKLVQQITVERLSPHLYSLYIIWQEGVARRPDIALLWRAVALRGQEDEEYICGILNDMAEKTKRGEVLAYWPLPIERVGFSTMTLWFDYSLDRFTLWTESHLFLYVA